MSQELSQLTGLSQDWIASYFSEQEQILLSDFKRYLKTDTKVFKVPGGDFVIGQIELWDPSEVVKSRQDEMMDVMQEYQNMPWIVNLPNISQGFNYIFSAHTVGKQVMEEKFGLEFEGNIARTPKLIMRKQIMAILREY